MKIPKEYHRLHKTPSRITCGLDVWDPWSRESSGKHNVCSEFSLCCS